MEVLEPGMQCDGVAEAVASESGAADNVDTSVCILCGKPVLPGEAHYSLTGNHYDCQFPAGRRGSDPGSASIPRASDPEVFAVLDAALQALSFKSRSLRKKRAPEGAGATALKVQALAVKAIEAELGAVLTDVSLWNQQGAYRAERWQLDRWGIAFSFLRDGRLCKGTASSLARMTDCVKAGTIVATPGDLAFSFQLDPASEQRP